MNLSTQRHGTLYKYEEISHMYQKPQGGMEARSTNKDSIWQYVSL